LLDGRPIEGRPIASPRRHDSFYDRVMPVFRRIQIDIVLGFALGLAGLTGLVYAVMPGRANLSSPEIGGSFSLIGQDGRVVTNADLAGRSCKACAEECRKVAA
jgi:cytochrome oxidase Cu insertion factor (SCO1/SenC/PrrC family)